MAVYALPVTVPASVRAKRIFSQSDLDKWRSWYGVVFDSLALDRPGSPLPVSIKSHEVRDWPVLSAPQRLLEVNMKTVRSPMVEAETECFVENPGELGGIVVFFELTLDPETRLSVSPVDADETNHWQNLVWLLPDPCLVDRGERLRIHYAHNAPERQAGITVEHLG